MHTRIEGGDSGDCHEEMFLAQSIPRPGSFTLETTSATHRQIYHDDKWSLAVCLDTLSKLSTSANVPRSPVRAVRAAVTSFNQSTC